MLFLWEMVEMEDLYAYWKRIRDMEKEIERLRKEIEKGSTLKETVRKVQVDLRA